MTWQYIALKVALRVLRTLVSWIDDVLEDPEHVVSTGAPAPNGGAGKPNGPRDAT